MERVASAPQIDYFPATFGADDIQALTDLGKLAIAYVAQDATSTITLEDVHAVAKTLIAADMDARTVMIFFMSLLDEETLNSLASQYPAELIEAAHTVSIIRLLRSSDRPKHPAIRKVLLRQLVLKVTHEVRVILVKIAGRLVMLRNARHWNPEQRQLSKPSASHQGTTTSKAS